MVSRTVLIGMVTAGTVFLGNAATAEPRPDASSSSEPAAGRGPGGCVTVLNVHGDHNVIAADRSVLAVGDETRLNANAGDVSSSGTLGVGGENSTLQSGASTTTGAHRAVGAGASPRPAESGSAPAPRRALKAGTPERFPFPIRVSGNGQATAISGYEDHSVSVSGEDQIAVYDDSNLFVDRNGKLNANTGDTDSSGLNAVDVSGSLIRSGDHTENGDEGEEPDDEDARQTGGPGEQTAAVPAAEPGGPRASGTVTDDGESSATGRSALTIGADGYDNLGIDLEGKRNIVTYDDSNVVVGGTGDVNAQIGDSDTGGAVVMGISDSDVRSGNST